MITRDHITVWVCLWRHTPSCKRALRFFSFTAPWSRYYSATRRDTRALTTLSEKFAASSLSPYIREVPVRGSYDVNEIFWTSGAVCVIGTSTQSIVSVRILRRQVHFFDKCYKGYDFCYFFNTYPFGTGFNFNMRCNQPLYMELSVLKVN